MGFDRYPLKPSFMYFSFAPDMAFAVRQIAGVFMFGPFRFLSS